MIKDCHRGKLLQLYNDDYNGALKPVLVLVESILEEHPAAVLNEIRAFNDHIARCYLPEKDDDFIKEHLEKAQGHLKRAIMDCFKNLNIHYFEEAKGFEEKYRKVDITLVNNGEFYRQYLELKKQAVDFVHEAKLEETLDFEKAFDLYQEGYLAYAKLSDFIRKNAYGLEWVKKRFFKKWQQGIIGGLIGIIIGSLLGSCVFTPLFDWSKDKIHQSSQKPDAQAKQCDPNETPVTPALQVAD